MNQKQDESADVRRIMVNGERIIKVNQGADNAVRKEVRNVAPATISRLLWVSAAARFSEASEEEGLGSTPLRMGPIGDHR